MMTFEELRHDVFLDYVQTAVIIDDQWSDVAFPVDDDESGYVQSEEDEGVADPAEVGLSGDADIPPSRRARAGSGQSRSDADLLGDLRQSLISEGVVACGLRYSAGDHEVAVKLAGRADILVLDWDLEDDDGDAAVSILEDLVGKSLRFVCIYTGKESVKDVRKRIQALAGYSPAARSKRRDALDGHLCYKNLMITIKLKPSALKEDNEGQEAEPEELLGKALAGFAQKFGGPVQLAMLEMTSRHRQHLPEILGGIGSTMDVAVLFESATEDSPVGPGGAFMNVLIDEWRSRLERVHAELRILGDEGLRAYGDLLAESVREADYSILKGDLVKQGIRENSAKGLVENLSSSVLREWLRSGQVDRPPAVAVSLFRKNEGHRMTLAAWLTLLHAAPKSESDPEGIVGPLLPLDALFHQQFGDTPRLTQGTVVVCEKSGTESFLICTTPLCDADRPKEKIGGMFSFVRTSVIPVDEILRARSVANYCVVRRDEGYLCLKALVKERVSLRVADSEFEEDGLLYTRLSLGGEIQDEVKVGSPFSVKLRRVAQLRLDHALALSAAAAADASRVGVNRVELIRSLITRS